jgi:PAS domain S-box-containing protein
MRIHAALSASERTAQAIIDTSLDAFVQFDLDGTILRWSPKAELMLGWKSDEAIGRTLRDLIIPEKSRDAHSQRIATLIQEFQSGGSGWRFGSTTLRRDGKEIVTEVSLTVQRTQNGYIINGFLRDMSGQHAAQEQLKQAQKMECVGQLTGGIAHDFNNLLTVITGTIDILSDAVDDKPHLVAITTLISKAADRAAELTANLLGFARQRPLEPQETDINALISDVCHLLEPTLGRHIEVHSMQEKDLWIARVDPSQLTAALVNLAINARDAMPDGGALTFETRNTRLEATDAVTSGLYDPGSYVLIKVSDNGAGIPDSILNKVFDPFFTTKDVGAGTGLGLSMVYGFVKQSGGHIEVSSELGRGTSFAIYLPKMRGAQGLVGPPAVDAVAVGGTETILCVEDDETVRSYVVAQLKSMGYEIIAAANAEQALAILKKGVAFDLLFTDFIMPGKMNGQQLACIAASGRPSLKVLFTSGFSGGVLDEPFESGLLLRKPYRRAELAKMVRAALNSESCFVANAGSVSGSLHS